MDQYCIILATQRSGTMGFGAGVEENFDVKWLGEVFLSEQANPDVDIQENVNFTHRRATSPQLNFFNFRRELFREDPLLCYPSEVNQKTIFDRYFSFISERVQRDHKLVDIKYDSWHHLNSYWLMPPQKPHLVRMVQAANVPVVHILRANYFAIYCSMRYALESGVWHHFEGKKKLSGTLEIDLQNCERRMKAIQFNRSWFQEMFSGCKNYFELNYEDLFDNNHLSDLSIETIKNIFNIEPVVRKTVPVRKVTPPLSEIVSNADAVVEYFKGGPFEEMVLDALDR